MDERRKKLTLALLLAAGVGLAVYAARSRPSMFANVTYLGGLIFLQVLTFAVWKFRQTFFLFLMVAFLWAGLPLPMSAIWTSARWAVLGAGAFAGLVSYMNQPQHRFGFFHLIAGLGVLASLVSALVSDVPTVSTLKGISLGFLFLYASCGGRAGIIGREQQFVTRLLTGCEVAAYVTAVSYFVFGHALWGNPNSLGLAMAITAPILFWGNLISESHRARVRLLIAFLLAIVLLVFSNSRASLLSCAIALAVLCLALRKNRLLLQGVAAIVCVASLFAILAPAKLQNFASESTETLVYKGHRQNGVLASRQTPWQQTIDSLRQHPWSGTGFGTSAVEENSAAVGLYSSTTATTREHGSSYLAILEWVGLLGSLPFLVLIVLLLRRILQTLRWLYRTGKAAHPAVPIAIVLLAGLVHVGFEDWLFAVGYYATVFYWTLAFSFMDLAPVLAPASKYARWVPAQVRPVGFAVPTTSR